LHYSYLQVDGQDAPYYTLTLNSQSGEIIDSTSHATQPFNDVVFSSDGRYAYSTGWGFTMVTDYATGDTIAIDRGTTGHKLELSADADFLLRSAGVALFELPDLATLYTGPGSGDAVFHPVEKVALFGKPSADSLFTIEYDQTPPLIRSNPLLDAQGNALSITLLTISPDGSQLVVNPGGMSLVILDMNSLEVITQFGRLSAPTHYLDLTWHPDGRRLFASYGGDFEVNDGGVNVYDAYAGVLYEYISQHDLNLEPDLLQPFDVSFSPDGEAIFLLSRVILGRGSLLKLMTDSKSVAFIFRPEQAKSTGFGLYPLAMSVED
jgi:WD40 repeat protein